MFKLGMDTGGTFTDLVVADDQGEVRAFKVLSTPQDPLVSVEAVLSRAAEAYGLGIEQFLAGVDFFIYGTTIVTNALITRSGVKTGLITTRGFEDITYFRMGKKWGHTIYDFKIPLPPPVVPGHLRIGVDERVRSNGEIVTPLDEEQVRDAIKTFKAEGVQSIAIGFLHSYENAVHERRAAEICRDEMPEAYVVQSADVLPVIREWERFSTTTVSAYVGPLIERYLRDMETTLKAAHMRGPLLIMKANGGTQSVQETVRRAAVTLNSGPSAGPSAAVIYDHLFGLDRIVSVDMGGTSLDISTVVHRSIPTINRKLIGGERIAFKMIDCHSLGAGGGSIVGFDEMGLLKVGPESAGASPGPICYGQGGRRLTVTDADVVLGYVPVEGFAGGDIRLDYDGAFAAMVDLAGQMKLDPHRTAEAISTVVNHNMGAAVLGFLVERGHDPRDFTLVAGGGASGVHMAGVAEVAHIPRVIIPKLAPTYCAWGMLFTNLIHDYVRSHRVLTQQADFTKLNRLYEEMEREAVECLAAEGVQSEDCVLTRSADMRYAGQYRELEVPVPSGTLTPEHAGPLEEAFHQRHQDVLLFRSPGSPVQFIYLRVKAVGRTRTPKIATVPSGGPDASHALKGHRPCFFGGALVNTAIFDGHRLLGGNRISGPAVVEETATTVVVPSGFVCEVDAYGGYTLQKADQAITEMGIQDREREGLGETQTSR